MTIAATITAKQYTSNGVTTQYAFPNKIFSAADLVVTLIDLVGNQYPFTNFANATTGLSYTVQGVDVDTGCIVVFSGVQTVNWTVDIRSLIPDTQSTSIKNQGSFFPELHEEAFDRVTRMIQDVLRLAYLYGIHGPDIETVPWPALPGVTARKGMALMFDAITGLPALGVPNTQTITTGLLAPFLNLQVTAAENAALVAPINLGYPPGNVLRYGTNTTPGTTDMTTAIANCLAVCGLSGDTCFIPAGTYKVTADLLPPVGVKFLQGGSGPFAVDIKGAGEEQTILQFTAGTNGVYFNGVSSYVSCGKISDLQIDGTTVLPTGLTFANCHRPRAERVTIRRCTGRGAFFNTTIMGRFDNCYVVACGSAGQAQVEILSSTTFEWHQSYCSSGNAAAVAAVRVDKSANTNFFGGAVETPGTIQIGALADAVTGCVGGIIFGVDFEKPTDHFLEFGYGLSAGAFIQGWQVRGNSGYPSGAASVPYAVKLNACTSIRFGDNNWSQNGSPTATYWLEGVTNNGVVIEAHPELYGSAWPWVMQNGAQIKWATPLVDFTQKDTIGQGNYPTVGTISGATASILVHATQGGIYRDLIMGNGGATTMTALTGGVRGMRITMISTNGNTTLTHSTVTADQWNLTLSGAANLLMVANKPYTFVHNGTNWYQVTN